MGGRALRSSLVDEPRGLGLGVVRDCLAGFATRGVECFSFVRGRVPGADVLPLVAIGPRRLMAIEVVSWDGAVEFGSREWVQITPRGDRVEHADPVRTLRTAAEDLRAEMESAGLNIDRGRVGVLLVLAGRPRPGPRAEVRSDVATISQAATVLPGLLGVRRPAHEGIDLAGCREWLRQCRRWDRVELRGGALLGGRWLGGLGLADGRQFDEEVARVELRRRPGRLRRELRWWNRQGLVRAVVAERGSVLRWRSAGEDLDVEIPVERMRRIEVASRVDDPDGAAGLARLGESVPARVMEVGEGGLWVALEDGSEGAVGLGALRVQGFRPEDFEPAQRLRVRRRLTLRSRTQDWLNLELDESQETGGEGAHGS